MPGYRQAILVIPPGTYRVTMPEAFHHMHRRHGVQLAFTDRAGVHWLRGSKGQLDEIKESPPDHYGLSLPVHWEAPRRADPPRSQAWSHTRVR